MEFVPNNIHDDISSNSDGEDTSTAINRPVAKKTRGRRKIEMKKIEKETNKMITFSKRKSGIYRKASELVILTGSEVAFLVFSPAGKAFTFAHPSFDYIAKKYLGLQNQDPSIMSYGPVVVLRQARTSEATIRYRESLEGFDNDTKRQRDLLARMERKALDNWWNRCIDYVHGYEIQGLEDAYLEVTNKVELKRMEVRLGINGLNTTAGSGSDPFASGSHPSENIQLLPQPPVDMGPQAGLMNMGQPNLTHSLPNFSAGDPENMEVLNGGDGGERAEASDPLSLFGSVGGGNGGVGYSSSIFSFPPVE